MDIAKYICSLLIVFIHASPLESSQITYFYTVNVICRTAVPLFFAISGFLFFRKITFSNGKINKTKENFLQLYKYIKHIAIIYLAVSVFYLIYIIPYWKSIGWWGLYAIKDYIISFLISGTIYHLWFLLALICGMIALFLFLCFVNVNTTKWICLFIWLAKSLMSSYSTVLPDIVGKIHSKLLIIPSIANGLLIALPFLFVGCISKDYEKHSKTYWRNGTIIFSILWIVEASIIHFCISEDAACAYILTGFGFSYFILNYLLNLEVSINNTIISYVIRKSSLLIYCIHPIIGYALNLFDINDFAKWLLVTIISIAIAAHLSYFNLKHKKTRKSKGAI